LQNQNTLFPPLVSMIEFPAHPMTPIGIIHSCYPQKFGIPRQPGLVKSSTGRLALLPPCDREEMVRGLDAFSHLWILFLFHGAVAEGWRPMVRPPWLGGQKRVGVFASRSPHRPNFMGLSVVRLMGIRREKKGLFLELAELDLLDQTPVFDIKPYVPYSDAVAGAHGGFIPAPGMVQREVLFTDEAEDSCAIYEQRTGRYLRALITETLEQDPRPASQRRRAREYGMALWEVNVRWQAEGEGFLVVRIEGVEKGE
jgi:tRNA (adenine37-N6)-methyltransferase